MKRTFQALVTCSSDTLSLPKRATKKLCKIVDVATAADIKTQLAFACCLQEQAFEAEYYDKDFDEWIPLEDPILLDGGKVKICLKTYVQFSSFLVYLPAYFALFTCSAPDVPPDEANKTTNNAKLTTTKATGTDHDEPSIFCAAASGELVARSSDLKHPCVC